MMNLDRTYDVLVVGGGPAGATIAALLAQRTSLSVLVIEQTHFPREHIGESFAQRVTSALAESGALGKVLASDCWVRKYGGIYAWDRDEPAISLFEHKRWEEDGILRWTLHADRAELDSILLSHAQECGAVVEQGVEVTGSVRESDTHLATLSDGRKVRCRFLVEATGRTTRLAARRDRAYLSSYRNVALWTHVVGGQVTQTLPGDWNLFRRLGVSAIGNFAFEDGWFWYIPVPRVVNGKRQLTHSLGMVTDPRVLKEKGKDYTDPETFFNKAKTIPLLEDLIAHARPAYDTLQTATNYSMMSKTFCDLDERWVLIGDAAYFVDPLFSSGVAFATSEAIVAARMIEATLDGSVPKEHVRHLWHDYDQRWHVIGKSFALLIDQWYFAIARAHPNSIYWQARVEEPVVDLRRESFHGLVDTDVSPDLLLVVTRDRALRDVAGSGPVASLGTDRPALDPTKPVALRSDVTSAESHELAVGRSKYAAASMGAPSDAALSALASYWSDPVRYAHRVPSMCPPPERCWRLTVAGDLDRPSVTHADTDALNALVDSLRRGTESYGTLAEAHGPAGASLLAELNAAEMLENRAGD